MRRLRTARAPEPDPRAAMGFDPLDLEGDPLLPTGDELPAFRPFGEDVPGLVLAEAVDEPDAVRIPKQARALAGLGRRLDAILLLRRHLEDQPHAADVRVLLAELLDEGGDSAAAVDELTAALGHAEDPAMVLVARGAIRTRQGDTAGAEQDLREAIRRRSRYAPARLHLGLALLRRDRAAEAVTALREALELGPDDPEATYYLGEALAAQGDLRGALSALERAAGLAPDHARAYSLMGRLLDRLGRTDDAMVMHRRAREATIR